LTTSNKSTSRRARALEISQLLGQTSLSAQQIRDARRIEAGKRTRPEDDLTAEQSKIQLRIKELKADLPHLYGYPFYQWAREFFESRNRISLLCAANQISKSSTAIRKTIEWACNKKLWPELWSTEPKIFWYFYPSDSTANLEFSKKWVPEFLPRGAMKNHENYGWDVEYRSGLVEAIHFKSGVSIHFRTYGQKIVNLQSSTVHMIIADEEMPEEYVDELLARLRAVRGYFCQVFTATRGLQLWYRAMECIGTEDEAFKTAYKRTVSMYECGVYEDGSPSPWTPSRIAEAESDCTSKKEVLKRIHGRFVKDEGLRYETFDPDRNIKEPEQLPKEWKIYAAVDIGSGGGGGRSSGAIVFIASNPQFTRARVILTWRGDHEETTAADILTKYRQLRGTMNVTLAGYDYASREFGLIASRSGEAFIRADKTKNTGEATLNTLFKSGALTIDDGVAHNQRLITELMSVPCGTKNRKYQDDLTDALRYAAGLVPWDFATINPGMCQTNEEENDEVSQTHWTPEEYTAWEIRQRRGESDPKNTKGDWQSFADDCAEWNEAYGS